MHELTTLFGYFKSQARTESPHFISMDRQNPARWLPVYIADMRQLRSLYPKVYEEFAAGNFAINRTCQPFSQVAIDMALE